MSVKVKSHSNGSVLVSPSTVKIGLTFNVIDYQYVKGFFGDQTTNLHGDTIDFKAFGTSLTKANVSFAAPQLLFTVTDDYGIPLKVTFNPLAAVNSKGQTLNVLINPSSPVSVNVPAS